MNDMFSGKIKTVEDRWDAINKGAFCNEYGKNIRTSLQKAIDKHETNIHVERKRVVEDGDLRMFDGTGWVQFCIHKAEKLINEDKMFVAIQRRVSGIWVNYSDEYTRIFNSSLDKNPENGQLKDDYKEHVVGDKKSFYGRQGDDGVLWRKMIDHDREEAKGEGNYGYPFNFSSRRKFI